MRPYRVVDDDYDADPHPRIVPISAAPRARAQVADSQALQRQPWTPREDDIVPIVRRAEPLPPPRAEPRPVFTPTHQIMLAAFFAICIGMVLAMVAWRIWSYASSPASSATTAAATAQLTAPLPPESALEPPLQGTGPIVTEIKVLQPNYSVAPGDTLGTIAQRHETTVDALASLNNLENRNTLRIGQRLVVP